MSKRKRKTAASSIAAAMDKQIRLDGQGEDPSVQAFLRMLEQKDPQERIDIMMALQKHITGMSDEDTPEGRERMLLIRANEEMIQAAEDAWEEDSVGFMETLNDKYPRPEGIDADRHRAKKVQEFQQKVTNYKALAKFKQQKLDYALQHGPKEEILVTGQIEVVNNKQRIVPDVIKIMHRTWVLPPGRHTVPKVVAERYRDIQKLRSERQLRGEAMSAPDAGGQEFNEFVKRQREIDRLYSPSDFSGGN